MVSVIVPVYNSEQSLSACIQSVVSQTYVDFEIILIDDGSADRSGQLCDEWQDICKTQNIPCQVVHQENRGVSAARNRGMELARGKYLVFVDSDDLVEPCYLEDLVHTAEDHPELGHVLCGFRCTSHVHDYVFSNREPLTVVMRKDYMRLFEKILILSPCLALYRTNIVQKNNISMREDLSLAEDLLFNMSYLDALGEVPIGIINKSNYIYQDEDLSSLNHKYRPDLLFINETVNRALAQILNRWEITDDASWQRYYNEAFYRYQTVLDNTFHKSNSMTLREKIKYNNAILNKKEFQEACRKSTAAVSPARKRAMKSGDYRWVMAVERMQKAKRAIFRFLER